MGEFVVRRATAADVDRLWPLFDEREGERAIAWDDLDLDLIELRRSALVALLLDADRPVLVAYSGIRAVGYAYALTSDEPYVAPGWRGLGVEVELAAAREHRPREEAAREDPTGEA